jgi:SulP family sulfate permease
MTVIYCGGVGLFGQVPGLDERWPDLSQTRGAVLIVSMRTLPGVPSSKQSRNEYGPSRRTAASS